jgi:hypothetical protein
MALTCACALWLQDVENMLEAYSLQADYYLAQLSDLSQLIDNFQERWPAPCHCIVFPAAIEWHALVLLCRPRFLNFHANAH